MQPHEHYLEAERLLQEPIYPDQDVMEVLARAQVHATLALVYRDQKE